MQSGHGHGILRGSYYIYCKLKYDSYFFMIQYKTSIQEGIEVNR